MLEQQEVRLPLPIFAKVIAPGKTKAVFFTIGGAALTIDSPATVGLRARHRYHFGLEGLTDNPSDRFYGTIEVLRGPCLPQGVKAADVPIPIRYNDEDVNSIVRGGMITKLIVIEDAEKSSVDYATADEPARYESTMDERDAIHIAKGLGKIAVVVRLGTRVPTVGELTDEAVPGSLLVPSTAMQRTGAMPTTATTAAFVYADSGTVTPVGHTQAIKSGHSHSFPPSANCAGVDGSCGTSPGCGELGAPGRCEACFLPETNREDCIVGPYVCDGGDRRPKVNFGQVEMLVNLDPEDTVAVFRGKDGLRKIVESNRVCIYAPKFAEIRLVQNPEGYSSGQVARRLEKDDMAMQKTQMLADVEKQQVLRLNGLISRKRPSVYVGEQWASNFCEVRVLAGYDRGIGWAQEIGTMRTGALTNSDQALLAKRVEFAMLLTNVQMPQLLGSIAGANELYRVRGVMETVLVEERPGKPKVKLEKFASVPSAKIGDTVRFTIKFSNIGKETVKDVSIVDSLHARLDYVPNTADGPLDAVFSAQVNEVGSMTLRWQLKNPLDPGQSGFVSFDAKMR